jgi:hypothetical protein
VVEESCSTVSYAGILGKTISLRPSNISTIGTYLFYSREHYHQEEKQAPLKPYSCSCVSSSKLESNGKTPEGRRVEGIVNAYAPEQEVLPY